MHKVIKPKILYFGTPVVLISTLNEDGSVNLAPISSAWWLGGSAMLGMSKRSKTVENLQRNKQCVLNLPSEDMVRHVNQLALVTGKNPVPDYKEKMGYQFEPNKFEIAGLTSIPSDLIEAPRVTECPVQLEGIIKNIHDFDDSEAHLATIEVKIIRVHVQEDLLVPGTESYIDPEKWNPLIMNFCEFFGLGGKLSKSRLAEAFVPLLKAQ